jgi:lipopolysaccharide transport system ATP-binding protein
MKVIEVENLSKLYDLGLVGTGTLSKDLNRAWAKITGKSDPYATLAELNDRTKKSKSGTVYALKDINFQVENGDVVGIIGKNGAGKSTLLKILSQITSPSSGNIKIKGRVASLLEVGTGMHPEMTARQNIYLNGSIMGMRRFEITRKLDEIVDFAGIGKYLDTPIKRFSSGMQVRLGFAVAAHLEPEILIVDEVLAVGDAEFQKKAIGKMQDISKGEGRTVLFVSHHLNSVKSLCKKGILLKNGEVNSIGNIEQVIEDYRLSSLTEKKENTFDNSIIKTISLINSSNEFYNYQKIELLFETEFNESIKNSKLLVQLSTISDTIISSFEVEIPKTNAELKLTIPGNTFVKGEYKINFIVYRPGVQQFENKQDVIQFRILDNPTEFAHLEGFNIGNVLINSSWEKLNS